MVLKTRDCARRAAASGMVEVDDLPLSPLPSHQTLFTIPDYRNRIPSETGCLAKLPVLTIVVDNHLVCSSVRCGAGSRMISALEVMEVEDQAGLLTTDHKQGLQFCRLDSYCTMYCT